MMKKFFAAINPYGIQYSYSSPGWEFLAFGSQEARDRWANDCCDRAGTVVREKVRKKDIPGVQRKGVAIIRNWQDKLPDGCLGVVGDKDVYGPYYAVVADV